jgi:hypothetical protein
VAVKYFVNTVLCEAGDAGCGVGGEGRSTSYSEVSGKGCASVEWTRMYPLQNKHEEKGTKC